jgi:hypothetical protein
METLSSRIEFGRTSGGNTERSSICLHCSAGVSALVIALTGHVK